jgi:hypothetical protein
MQSPEDIPARVTDLVEGGATIFVATRDVALVPRIARAWGVKFSDPDGHLDLCVEAPPGSATRDDLAEDAEIALTFTRPSTHRSLQVKGRVLEVKEPEEAQLELAGHHHASFVLDAASVGLAPRLGSRIFDRGALLSVSLIPEEHYDQTPGPDAGARL